MSGLDPLETPPGRSAVMSGPGAPRWRWRVAPLLGLAAIVVLASSCGGRFWFPTSVTKQGDEASDLWRVFIWVAAAIGLLVYALVAIVLIGARRRRHQQEMPSQRQYHIPLEVFWTAVPLVIIVVLYGLSIRTQNRITNVVAHPDLTVEVVGFQWQWQFRYPDSGIVVTGVPGKVPVLVLPTQRTVQLDLKSSDVIHSFWVPHFIEKRDLIPGVNNRIDINITTPGAWTGVCSEFCGLDHWKMNFGVRALPPEQFDAWVASGGISA